MATFSVRAKDGSLVEIPDGSIIEIQGLKIIGDNVTDWNEPIQQNFLIVSNAIGELADDVVVIQSDKADVSYVDMQISTVSDLINSISSVMSTDQERIDAVASLISGYTEADISLKNLLTNAIVMKADSSIVAALEQRVADLEDTLTQIASSLT